MQAKNKFIIVVILFQKRSFFSTFLADRPQAGWYVQISVGQLFHPSLDSGTAASSLQVILAVRV